MPNENQGCSDRASGAPLTSAALDLAKIGVAVFPCGWKGLVSRSGKDLWKTPLVRGGFKSASKDPAQIIRWWEKWPTALIGVPSGQTRDGTGSFVLDVDTHPDKPDGRKSLAALEQAHGALPPGPYVTTPQGGIHRYFTCPADSVPDSSADGRVGESLDIRGRNGYTIAPPSPGWTWYDTHLPIPAAPEWLLNLMRKEKRDKPSQATPLPAPPEHGMDHSPNAAIVTDALRYVSADTPREPWTRILMSVKSALGDAGEEIARAWSMTAPGRYSDSTFDATWKSITPNGGIGPGTLFHVAQQGGWRRQPDQPAPSPKDASAQATDESTGPFSEPPVPWDVLSSPPPPFPLEALPPVLADMAQAVAETYAVPPEAAGAAVLGVASIAARNASSVRIKADHFQHPNLYILAAMPVGCGKSPMLRPLQKPLLDWQKERRPDWESAMRRWKAKQQSSDAQKRGMEDRLRAIARKGGGQANDVDALEASVLALTEELGEAPYEPVSFISDGTSEAIGRRMAENGEAMGILSSEGRRMLDIAAGRYAQGGDVGLWLNGHGYDFTRVERQGKPSYTISHPCLSALLLTQPDALQALGRNPVLRDSGFLARFLYIVPQAISSPYSLLEVADVVVAQYAGSVRRLLEMKTGADGKPWTFGLDQGALVQWKAFHDSAKAGTVEGLTSVSPFLGAWLTKLPEHAARIALLLHLTGSVRPAPTIAGETVAAALRLAECFRAHALRAEALIGATSAESQARAVWEWLDRNRDKLRELRRAEGLGNCETTTVRDLCRSNVAGIKSAKDAKAVLTELVERGWLYLHHQKSTKGAMHDVYLLRPRTD